MREGDIVISCYSESTADAIGIVSGGYSWNPEYTEYKRVRPVKWIAKGSFNITDINGGKNMTLSTVYKLNNIEMDKLYTYMAEEKEVVSENKDNYVFIIDEINRGNVSKILGETITLIEESKRKGAEEELLVTLPYSGKKFGVPQNVYIIGTMNTADRSIATLDTALRRRFYFKEMLPNPDVLAGIEVGGVSISNLLERINKRIEVLYDREHTIGHSYFMALKKDPSIDALARIFENNIIPLLQEYFYEDYEKIRLVLGDSKKADKDTMFIIAEQNDYSALFGNVDIGLDDGYSYKINKKAFTNIEAYKSI
jgi:5-methylcytosine-specific restriction protein B